MLPNDFVFWFCALSGAGLFLIQLVVNFLGGHLHQDLGEGSGSIDASKFKWLSKQALTGFLLMFGLVGLTCQKEFEFSMLASTLIAIGGGALTMIATGLLFRSAKKLQSSGTVFRLDEAIGKEAMVYQRIPKQGAGKISLSLHNLTYEIDAVSHGSEELASFTQVQIIKKIDDKTVIVIPIK